MPRKRIIRTDLFTQLGQSFGRGALAYRYRPRIAMISRDNMISNECYELGANRAEERIALKSFRETWDAGRH